jgi:hypothetical protein
MQFDRPITPSQIRKPSKYSTRQKLPLTYGSRRVPQSFQVRWEHREVEGHCQRGAGRAVGVVDARVDNMAARLQPPPRVRVHTVATAHQGKASPPSSHSLGWSILSANKRAGRSTGSGLLRRPPACPGVGSEPARIRGMRRRCTPGHPRQR